MRKLLFVILAVIGFIACKDDEEVVFDVPVEFRKELSFRPVPGGAVMTYYLPDNVDIYGLRVRYTDAWGELKQKDASYLSDTLLLDGFTEARTDVPAKLTFFNNAMEESEPIDFTFDTEESATVALFDSLEVKSFWGGFSLRYVAPETVNGMLHVFYLGTNPLTKLPDSILMASYPIASGGDTLNFILQQVMDKTDVIVRTDDFNGKRVKQKIFPDMQCLVMDTLQPDEFDFKFTGGILENDEYALGPEYLFDGDKLGLQYRRNRLDGNRYKYSTFMTEEYAFGERFIIDLGEEKVPAAVSLYAYLDFASSWPTNSDEVLTEYPDFLAEIWNGNYHTHLPAKVKLYGTNDDPETASLPSCTLLYELDDEVSWSFFSSEECWCYNTDGSYMGEEDWMAVTEDEVKAADPIVLKMLCNYEGDDTRFRYLFFIVEDTYPAYYYNYAEGTEGNPREYITFNELEVCVKAENK